MKRSKEHLSPLAMLASVLLLGACGQLEQAAEETAEFIEDEVEGAQSRLRMINVSPTAEVVDWFIDDDEEAAFEDVDFLDVTPYRDLASGVYDFFLSPEGATQEEALLTLEDVELEGERTGTLVAFDGPEGLTTVRLEDDPDDLDGAADVRFRFLHGAPEVGAVDVWLVTEDGSRVPAFDDVQSGEQTEPLDASAGRYTVEVDQDADDVADLSFELPRLGAGTVVSLFALQDEDGEVFLWALIDGTVAVRLEPQDDAEAGR